MGTPPGVRYRKSVVLVLTPPVAERILSTYSLEEILEHAETTSEDALCFLVNEEFIELPEILPVDLDD